MRKKSVWYAAGVLILGVALLVISCGGPVAEEETAPPVEEEEVVVEEEEEEEPKIEEPAVEEPTTPTGGPTATPHPLEGRENCLTCHGEGTFKPFPADHAGRSNDTCISCHQPTE